MLSSSLHLGDMRDVLATFDAESIDAVVTDPPYELGFMGKRWDNSGVSFDPETWRACHRVLKPGGHLLAFGGTRTVHRIAVAIEDAGFEIRDQIAWLFGSGFPKSHNLGNGYGTALKPAMEPIVVARKPLIGTVAANVTAHGTGALNIDGCRIGTDDIRSHRSFNRTASHDGWKRPHNVAGGAPEYKTTQGRWPANVALDEDAAAMLDAQSGERPGMKTATLRRGATTGRSIGNDVTLGSSSQLHVSEVGYDDTGGASRFFYVAKASRSERNAGLGGMEKRLGGSIDGTANLSLLTGSGNLRNPMTQNHHPTVKPVALMRWLIRLVSPPDGAVILDPFLGSGTTGIAAVMEDVHFVGIEQSAEYLEIARRRIDHARGPLFQGVSIS